MRSRIMDHRFDWLTTIPIPQSAFRSLTMKEIHETPIGLLQTLTTYNLSNLHFFLVTKIYPACRVGRLKNGRIKVHGN